MLLKGDEGIYPEQPKSLLDKIKASPIYNAANSLAKTISEQPGAIMNWQGPETKKPDVIPPVVDPKPTDALKTALAGDSQPVPVAVGPSIPAYTGMSISDLKNALLTASRAGVNASADSQLSIIKQNLASALSDLEAEKATGQSNLDKQIRDISDNQFATTELSKERMNQGGWNMDNSGLAQGEVDRIGIGADKSRADANGNLAQILNDIARRGTLTKTNADTATAGVEKVRGDQLAGTEAQALLDSENTAYSRYRDSVSDSQWGKNYDLNKSGQDFNQAMTKAQMTGTFADGTLTLDGKKYTSDEASVAKNDAWNRVNALGTVDAQSAKILGIPEGTTTLEAKKLKLDSDLAIAGVTGVYDGKPTLAGKEFNWNTDTTKNPQLAAAVEGLKEDKSKYDEWVKQAPQRLDLLNAQVKSAKTQADIDSLEKIAQQQTNDLNKINLKYAPQEAQQKINESRASINNINSEIQNRKDQLKIDQQNANTAANKSVGSTVKAGAYKTDPDFADEILWVNQHPSNSAADISANADKLILKYGYDGYTELVKKANPKKSNDEVNAILAEALKKLGE